MNYSIYNSINGELLIEDIELPEDRVENLSSDNEEGHFRAGRIDAIVR